jgi:glycosyltransferase A (GT-A) superfamily protein (DUF2064 family)
VTPTGPTSPAERTASGALTVLVLAKAPAPGRSKTRLAPAFGAFGAAELAAAALQDTLDAVAASGAGRRVLVLDGELGASGGSGGSPLGVRVPDGFELVPQRSGGHAVRIAAALAACPEPALLIGMDTPQVTAELLTVPPTDGVDAWFGPALDGGWWALGLREPARYARAALLGVPMSTPRTGAAQRFRLYQLGLVVRELPMLRDVDEPSDVEPVAALLAGRSPGSRFAATFSAVAASASAPASAPAARSAVVGVAR